MAYKPTIFSIISCFGEKIKETQRKRGKKSVKKEEKQQIPAIPLIFSLLCVKMLIVVLSLCKEWQEEDFMCTATGKEKGRVVREGCLTDVSAVVSIEAAVFSDPWQREAVAAHVAGGHLVFLVLEEAGSVIGYLLGSYIPPEGEIYRVAVLPERRRCGGGRELCEAFLSRTEACYLEVRRGNSAARALYESLGFLLTGERKNYYKNPTEDACLYRR